MNICTFFKDYWIWRDMKSQKLLDRVRSEIRYRRYSIRTEKSYIAWIKRYIYFHGKRHPLELTEKDIRSLLNHLVSERHVSASTQNQALCSIVFLYRHVLKSNLNWIDDINWSKRPKKPPVVFTKDEVIKCWLWLTANPGQCQVCCTAPGSGSQSASVCEFKTWTFAFTNWPFEMGEGKKTGSRFSPIRFGEEASLRHYQPKYT